MIGTWLQNDLKSIHATHPVVVLIDESGDANFLCWEHIKCPLL